MRPAAPPADDPCRRIAVSGWCPTIRPWSRRRGPVPGLGRRPRHRPARTAGRPAAARRSVGWLTALAFVVVAAPSRYAVVRLATAPDAHVTLPDDLALIDLHVRRALEWKQQVGVFDHNNWNHPGPTYFYLVSLVYRVLGSSARSLFVGATLLNGLRRGGLRRRGASSDDPGPRAVGRGLGRPCWPPCWPPPATSATTYSESVLGGPGQPVEPDGGALPPAPAAVLLCAGAVDRSGLSLVGRLLVGSFVVQTDISTRPLVGGLVGAVAAVDLGRSPRSSTGGTARARRPDGSRWLGSVRPVADRRGGSGRLVGVVVLVLMWLPPIVQQFTNHPGNLTLIDRFFTAGYPGHTVRSGIGAVAAVSAILVEGPAEVMRSNLAIAPRHGVVAATVALVALAAGVTATVIGLRQRLRFAAGLGILGLVGTAATVVAATRVVGHLYGYLVVWAVAVPVALLIGVGMIRVPRGAGAGAGTGAVPVPVPVHRPPTSRSPRARPSAWRDAPSPWRCPWCCWSGWRPFRRWPPPPTPRSGRSHLWWSRSSVTTAPSSSTTAAPAGRPTTAACSTSRSSSDWSTSSASGATTPRSTGRGGPSSDRGSKPTAPRTTPSNCTPGPPGHRRSPATWGGSATSP